MSHIFVSYSHDNEQCATDLVIRLQTAGFAVWQDAVSLRPSENWIRGIRRGIVEASAFVVLWSASAKKSDWVNKEIDIALTEHDKRELPIYQLLLDSTSLHESLESLQTYSFDACTSRQIDDLMRHLPDGIQWRLFDFDANQSLDAQGAEAIKEVSGYQSLQLLKSGSERCKAFVVGLPNSKRQDEKVLRVALRFTLSDKLPFLSQVIQTVQYQPNETKSFDDFFGLYVEGPHDYVAGRFWMNNEDPALWLECVYTIHKAIDMLIAGQDFQQLHIYSAAPQALVMGLALRLFKHYPLEIYNNLPPRDNPPYYQAVLNSRTLLQ